MSPEERPTAILVRGGTVLTMDPARRVIERGDVLIRAGRIAAVGTRGEVGVPAAGDDVRVIEAPGSLVLPGFVNTHTHLFQGLLKGLGDDRPLYRWLREMTAPAAAVLDEEHCASAAFLGAVEALRSGTTTIVDFMYAHPRPRLTDAVIDALSRSGIRAVVCRGFVTRGTENGVPQALIEPIDAALADAERLLTDERPDALVRVGVAPCLLWMVDEAVLRATRAFADAHRTLISYHLAETSFEVEHARAEYGMTEVELLARAGLLGPDLLAVHCTKVSEPDIRVMRAHDVKVSHNPISNMYLAAGVAPIRAMLDAGLTVGLATDGPASNNNQNMVHVLKATALLHKVAHEDAEAMTAARVLEMATIGGARAIGMESEIGSLEVGKRADITVMDFDNAFVGPVHDPASALVYAALGTEPRWVIVDGRVLLDDRRLTSLDEDAVVARAWTAAIDLAKRASVRVRNGW